ncbi:hypothetical protein STIAU_3077 [Stigmatella aurantiaca DW4/3-1]|uniref:Uncharacterized protein n=3 Tax=Stigmatella aurantiaca TaxID=41 RepID=Q097D3_STIAD|nr:hypothetical protein STIAU_3077 [Stigmatella aurantiaca DW4/3-1]
MELEQRHVLMLITLLNFTAETGQLEQAEDFFIHQREYAPIAIAHFESREEAEAWLNGAVEPPSPARILIGDEYHQLGYTREDKTRGMCRDYAIEPVTESMTVRGIPSPVLSFATRTEAEAWLMKHPADPYDFVATAGAYWFAVHHRRLNRHLGRGTGEATHRHWL